MGTRADFYIRKDNQMTWLGSKAFDGYPDGIDKKVLKSKSGKAYVKNVDSYLSSERTATFPAQGWPWPWSDSRTTDYAYIFDGGKVRASCFGSELFDPLVEGADEEDETERKNIPDNYFPDMSAIKNVSFGERSGLIVISSK